MACLLKFPQKKSKGIVTFTTQEQLVINKSTSLLKLLSELRKQYVIGLHFNWHNYQFSPDPSFDFYMANESDIRTVDDTPFSLIPMDACNFTSEIYSQTNVEKFWDVLIIGNPVYFKRPEVALRTIRELFDTRGRCRVLYICPLPEYSKKNESTVFYNIREYYEALFTVEERTWFTLVTTTFNSPFPFDKQTLSVFYKNSKVFLHTPSDERRCRIAAYAWCSGLPVVAYPSVASILPESLQKEPGYFRVDDDSQYVAQISAALKKADTFDSSTYQQELSEKYMLPKLKNYLNSVFEKLTLPFEGELLDKNLDLRLGWHHHNISGTINGIVQPLDMFMRELMRTSSFTAEYKEELEKADYPERILAKEIDELSKDKLKKVIEKSVYLKPISFWMKLNFFLKNKLKQLR